MESKKASSIIQDNPLFKSIEMKASYDPFGQRWRVVHGDNIVSIAGTMSFETKDSLKAKLKLVGLKLEKNNKISTVDNHVV